MDIASVFQCRSVFMKLMFGSCCILLAVHLYLAVLPDSPTYPTMSYCGNFDDRTIPRATLNYERNNQQGHYMHGYYEDSKSVKQMETDVFRDRAARLRNVCLDTYGDSLWKDMTPSGDIWTFSPIDVHFCIVPKVGCTYWKQVLRFISGDVPKNETIIKPSGVNRTFVHYGNISNIWETKLAHPVTRMLVSSGNSFMFSRHPYQRLWSAYIDKAVLPDFWRTSIRPIMKEMRPGVSEDQIKCPHNITFEEFLTFISKKYPKPLNSHWDPIFRICSPCQVNYKFIGKLETFDSDTKAILDDLGLSGLAENTSKAFRDIGEIDMLTKYNFRLEKTVPAGCLNKEKIARRLWTAFQYNGYIHRDTGFPLPDMLKDNFTSHPADVFTKHVLWTVKHQSDRGIDIKHQKHDMMIEAYQKIPANVMEGIKRIYEYDFKLFGYNATLT